ncbi:MAG TPA: hypothetical protein VE912_17585, partial [Bacteroidales bacterium]|nr:hypothetical protein [Bacteroidales bacterium]
MSYDEKTKKGLFRLAHFHPNFEDKHGNQVVDYLVLDALNIYETENQVTPEEICRVINSTHNLAFEESEIETSARRLNESEYVNLIEPHKRGQTPKFSITKNIKEKIDTNLVEVRRLENKVFSEWEEELKEKYDETKVLEVIDELIENFQGFLTKLFIRHGIQCVSLLYPDQIKEKGWWKKTRSNIINELPTTNPFINTLLDFEIPIFFNSENLNRIKYLTTLFTSSFYWHLIQVDHDCSRLFQEVTQGQKLILDNNILYNMVGLNGDYLLRGIHNLLKNAKKLGYEIWVTEKTIEEFHASLDYKKNEIKKHPGLPKEFARLASDNLSADNPLVIYWKEYVNSGKSVDEFISERSHIESILNDFEINITDEFHDEINHSDELQYEMDLLREACGSYFNDNIVEHDAFHRIFIKRIRGSIKKHFVEAGAWFLTNDGKLPVYSNYAVEDSKELSFCILVDQWVQINRPMLMRVDGEPQYEKTFHSLVVQPYVRAFISSDNLANVMNFILSRVEKYEHMSP